MNNQEYVQAAHRTMSDGFHGELVGLVTFYQAVQACIVAAQNLDKIKKALYYGRALPEGEGGVPTQLNCNELVMGFAGQDIDHDITTLQHRIMHGIIGKATEAGELLEAMQLSLGKYGVLDFVNVGEECGDAMWYDAILLEAIGTDISTVQEINIAKLKARFPNKFTQHDAQNRDLEAERKVLEG